MGDVCTKCKGVKSLCGAKRCPHLKKKEYLKDKVPKLKKKDMMVESKPDFLVGEYGYPNVNLGPLSTPVQMFTPQSNPTDWAQERKEMDEILGIRLSTLFPRDRYRVRDARNRNKIQNLSISSKPVDMEIGLKKEPKVKAKLDSEIPAVGLSGDLEKLDIVGNISGPRKVENAVEEDVLVKKIAPELWEKDVDYYQIMRLLSTGMLGRKRKRKFVPTRWAITATDSTLGDYFLDHIRDHPSINTGELYFRKYLGNLYYILLLPSECWRMERFEAWLPNSVWTDNDHPSVYQTHESYDGEPEKKYGGYFAHRYAILEHLVERKKKAAALVVRVVTPEYYAPVGSWQIRENVSLALKEKPLKKGSLSELLFYIQRAEGKRLRLNFQERSWLVKELRTPTLDDFIR